jgi:flagellar basal-body rod protein FlgB
MDVGQIGLFSLADKRLAWLDQRQLLLSQNIANVDTPQFQEKDLMPFASTLSRVTEASSPVQTNPMHLPGTTGGALQPDGTLKPPERAPDGNAVALDDELVKVADVDGAQQLTTNLYNTYLGMFRTALDRS